MVTEKDFETSHLRLEQDSGKKDAPVTPASMAGSLLLPVGLLVAIGYLLYQGNKNNSQSVLSGPGPAQVVPSGGEVAHRHSLMMLAPKTTRQETSEQERRILGMMKGNRSGRSQREIRGGS